ncbi:unnamed protein product [Absidia cylindrospora]
MAGKSNGIIVGSLKTMVNDNQHQWETMLPAALYAYRTKVHSTMKISPFEALFAQVPSLPVFGNKILGYERLVKLWGMRTVMTMDQDDLLEKIAGVRDFNRFRVGDKVLLLAHKRDGKNKLDPKYLSTVFIITKAYKNAFRLISEDGVVFPKSVNAKSLKSYQTRIDVNGIDIS